MNGAVAMKLNIFCLFLVIFGAATGFVKTGNALEFKLAKSENFPILFNDDEIIDYYKTGWDSSYTKRSFLLTVIPASSQTPRVEIVLEELGPRYYINSVLDVTEIKNLYAYLKASSDQNISLRQGISSSYAYEVIKNEKRECASFSALSGQSSSDVGVAEGTKILHRYYCNPENVELTDEKILGIFDKIEIKKN